MIFHSSISVLKGECCQFHLTQVTKVQYDLYCTQKNDIALSIALCNIISSLCNNVFCAQQYANIIIMFIWEKQVQCYMTMVYTCKTKQHK